MPYRLEWSRRATRQIDDLPEAERRRVLLAIKTLADNPYPPPPHGRKLADGSGYRLRVGRYRVVYAVETTDPPRVVVSWVGLRRDAYR